MLNISQGVCQENSETLVESLKLLESKMANIDTLATKFVQEKDLALFKQKIEKQIDA